MTKIDPGTHWNHKREGYGVTIGDLSFERVWMKDANDARFQPAVAFVRDDDAETLLVRTNPDFLAKFTQDERLGDEE